MDTKDRYPLLCKIRGTARAEPAITINLKLLNEAAA